MAAPIIDPPCHEHAARLRSVENRVENMPNPEALLADWTKVTRASRAATEAADRACDAVQGLELKLSRLAKEQGGASRLALVRAEEERRVPDSDPPVEVDWEPDLKTGSISVDKIRRHPEGKRLAVSRWTWAGVAALVSPAVVELARALASWLGRH